MFAHPARDKKFDSVCLGSPEQSLVREIGPLPVLLSCSSLCLALMATTLLLASVMLLSQAPQKDTVIVLREHFQGVFEHVCCICGLVAALS